MLTALKNNIIKAIDRRTSLQKAIGWVKDHRIPGSGIACHHKTDKVTPEVTGYLITSLFSAGEKELAFDLAKWEASVQQPDGSFLAPDGIPYTFDTAQVARGFLSVLDDMPEVETGLRKACDFVISQIDQKGEIQAPSYETWRLPDGSIFSKYCNLFDLPPLIEAGKRLNQPVYTEAAKRSLLFYKSRPDLVEFKPELGTLSHIFGYMMEALADLGETDLARKGLAQATAIQKQDGSIPAYPGVDWICPTGIAQIGIAWAKIGEYERAKRSLAYLEKIQNPSGGFYGSFGKGAQYLAGKEVSWAVKFFIDLHLLMKAVS